MLSLLLLLPGQTVELIYGGGKDTEYFQKANALVAQGKYQEAIGYYNKAIEVYPGFKEAYNNMGVVYTMVGDTQAGMRAFFKAHELDSLYIDPILNLASNYAAQGVADSALYYYKLVLKLDPDNPKAVAAFAQTQQQAVEGSDTLPAQDSSSTAQNQGQGQTQQPDSIALAEQALREDPSEPQNYYDLAVLLDKAGRYEEALDYYYGFLNTSGDDPKYQAMREFASKRLQQLAKALRRK